MCAAGKEKAGKKKLKYAKPSFEKVYELSIRMEKEIRSIDKAEVDAIKKFYAVDENIGKAIGKSGEHTEEEKTEEKRSPSEDELRRRFNKVARDALLFRQRKKMGLI